MAARIEAAFRGGFSFSAPEIPDFEESGCAFRGHRLQAAVRTVRQGMPWPFFTLEPCIVTRLEFKKNGVAKCPR
jgi:hypothetical protein